MNTDTDLDFTVLEHLDFDITCIWRPVTKNFTTCGEKAVWVIKLKCPHCSVYHPAVYTCDSCKELALLPNPLVCPGCMKVSRCIDVVVSVEKL